MFDNPNPKSKALLDRLITFAINNQQLVNELPKNSFNLIYGRQLIKSSSSPGSNYIEAVEASSKLDFIYRLKVCKKETKESIYWQTLIIKANANLPEIKRVCDILIKEAKELVKIFSSSISTAEKNLSKKH